VSTDVVILSKWLIIVQQRNLFCFYIICALNVYDVLNVAAVTAINLTVFCLFSTTFMLVVCSFLMLIYYFHLFRLVMYMLLLCL